MEITIIEILIYSILPTLIGLYFTERVKGKVKSSFDKKLEVIKKEHSIEIANFQAEIKSLKDKENFKFSKLHEKRFELLETIYIQMSALLDSIYIYTRLKPYQMVLSQMIMKKNFMKIMLRSNMIL